MFLNINVRNRPIIWSNKSLALDARPPAANWETHSSFLFICEIFRNAKLNRERDIRPDETRSFEWKWPNRRKRSGSTRVHTTAHTTWIVRERPWLALGVPVHWESLSVPTAWPTEKMQPTGHETGFNAPQASTISQRCETIVVVVFRRFDAESAGSHASLTRTMQHVFLRVGGIGGKRWFVGENDGFRRDKVLVGQIDLFVFYENIFGECLKGWGQYGSSK